MGPKAVRLAIVSDVVGPFRHGGMERRVWEIARRLATRGHEVHILTMKWWEGPQLRRISGVTFHGVSPLLPLYSGKRRSIRQALAFACHVATYLVLKPPQVDILEVQAFPYFPVLSSRLVAHVPLVVTWHEVWGRYWMEYLDPVRGRLAMLIERACARIGNMRVAVSQDVAQALGALAAKPPVQVIQCGVDLETMESVGPLPQGPDVVFVGRLLAHKGVDLLLHALDLLGRDGRYLTAAIVGDGPERKRLEQMCCQLGLGSRVKFLGNISDLFLFSLLKASKVLALPSRREGFGLVVLEANACGLPAVVLDHPMNAARLLVRHGYNGFLAPPTARGLAEMLDNAIRSAPSMREACRQFASAYDWDVAVSQLERKLAQVADEQRVQQPARRHA